MPGGDHHRVMDAGPWDWPPTDEQLVDLQHRLAGAADAAVAADPWTPPAGRWAVSAGCFVAYARGEAGPGRPGDRAWAAAVVWTPAGAPGAGQIRRGDLRLRGRRGADGPRQASDVLAQAVIAGRVPSAYAPGLLARREGPILAAAVAALDRRPEVLLVDATGLDHPRAAGLAIHLGAVSGIPTVGVTRRTLEATGSPPPLRRGATAPVTLAGRRVGYWLCTRNGARALVAHAGWRTSPETAARVVLDTSTPSARTSVPLQEARRVARESRSLAGDTGEG